MHLQAHKRLDAENCTLGTQVVRGRMYPGLCPALSLADGNKTLRHAPSRYMITLF
jgi:hypothetical protein